MDNWFKVRGRAARVRGNIRLNGKRHFWQLAAAAIPYILQAASAAGGIFGNKRKHIDPEYLRQKYGASAVSKETMDLFNHIINSPQGQQLMAGAAEGGQAFSNDVNAKAAAAGIGAGGGASSGTGVFATSAGEQAQSGFERQTKAGIYQAAMPVAADMVNSRMQAELGDKEGTPTQGAQMWQGIGQAAAGALAARGPKAAATPPPVAAPPAGTKLVPAQSLLGIDRTQYRPGLSASDDPAKTLSRSSRKRQGYGQMMQSVLNGGSRNVQPQYGGY